MVKMRRFERWPRWLALMWASLAFLFAAIVLTIMTFLPFLIADGTSNMPAIVGLATLTIVPPLFLARWVYRRMRWGKPKDDGGECLKCGYDLTGNVTGRCPECGYYTLDARLLGTVARSQESDRDE
jgi:hypothetical protein